MVRIATSGKYFSQTIKFLSLFPSVLAEVE